MKKQFKAETIVAKLFAGMTERKQALIDGGHVVSTEIKGILAHLDPEGSDYRPFLHAVNQTRDLFDYSFLLAVIAKPKMSGANDVNYIQCKTIVKVLRFIKAFGEKRLSAFDNHTRCLLINAMVNSGTLSAQASFKTLVRVEYDALESQDEKLAEKRNYSEGTGSTQVSSTRECLRVLQATEGVKGAKNAPIVLLEHVRAAMLEHFDMVKEKVEHYAGEVAAA